MIIEPNTKTDFYYVDGEYIDYLKQAENDSRGFNCVPNVHYWSTEKFVFGTVLLIDDIPYFAPVTSYSKKQQDLVLIKDKKTNKILGSLRFNYMIPVPRECLHKLNIADLPTEQSKAHAGKELKYCRRNRDKIYKAAMKTYERVTSKRYDDLLKNSCDFELLEAKYYEYIEMINENNSESSAPTTL